MDYLKFKETHQINNRCYYTADFKFSNNSINRNHTHDFYEVITVTSGDFIEYNNEKKFILDKGYVHFIKPTDAHYLVTNENKNNILRNIVFEEKFFEICFKDIKSIDIESIYTPFKLDEKFFNIFKEKIKLLDRIDNTDELNIHLIKSIVYDFIIAKKSFDENKDTIPKWLKYAYLEMQKEENYIIGLDCFIEICGKSHEHLTRQLKKYYNTTPTDLINNLRIQKIASLLCLTDDKILDIALSCGFENMSYFNRVFKQKYGVSPRQYRDINKNFLK